MASIRKTIVRMLHPVLKPLSKAYLGKVRDYELGGMRIKVFPGVFHPGLFLSTRILLKYIKAQELQGKTFLELGSGTGLLSVQAAKSGAQVWASDISQRAIENVQVNAKINEVAFTTVLSDLFSSFEKGTFDWIIINPPYFAKEPQSEEEFAWYCGEDFSYFKGLFSQLHDFVHEDSNVVMILSEDCDLTTIKNIALDNDFQMNELKTKRFLGEDSHLFQIQRK